jgi:hypothetical protein
MIEVAAAISMAVSAYNGIKKAVEMGREAEDVVGYFSRFFDAKEAISEASQYNENTPLVKKLFTGKSVEAQALEITAAKHKTVQLEKELREFLIYSGQGQFYEDMMRERRNIREARIAKARESALTKKFWIDVFFIGGLVAAILATLFFIVGLIIGVA